MFGLNCWVWFCVWFLVGMMVVVDLGGLDCLVYFISFVLSCGLAGELLVYGYALGWDVGLTASCCNFVWLLCSGVRIDFVFCA